MEVEIVKECGRLEEIAADNNTITFLTYLWQLLKTQIENKETFVMEFDALHWCSANLIFQPKYQDVETDRKYELQNAMASCEKLLGLDDNKKRICKKLAQICASPWSCPLFTFFKMENGRLYNGECSQKFAAALWESEGPVTSFQRVKSMVESNDETLEHLLQGLLSHFSCVESNRFSELISRNSRAFLQEQKSDIYALYGISCYLGQISPEVFLSLSNESACLILLSLFRARFQSDCHSVLLETFSKRDLTQASILLSKKFTWKLLASDSSDYETLSFMYDVWMFEHQNQPDLVELDDFVTNPLEDIESNLQLIQSSTNCFHITKLLQPTLQRKRDKRLFLNALVTGICFEVNKFSPKATRNRDLNVNSRRLIAKKFIELSFYCGKSSLKVQCMLAAFSLYPCADMYLAMFLENIAMRNFNLNDRVAKDWPLLREIGILPFDTLKQTNHQSTQEDMPDEMLQRIQAAILSSLNSELIGVDSKAAAHTICLNLLLPPSKSEKRRIDEADGWPTKRLQVQQVP